MLPVVSSRERPLRRLIETADEALSAWYGDPRAGPRESTHPAREQILFTSRERILAGDWTMHRTPSVPPSLRESSGDCFARSLVYDLPTTFSGAYEEPRAQPTTSAA